MNWRSFAKKFVNARPEWKARLVDLRAHGASQATPGPDTLEQAAQDVLELAHASPTPIRGVLGHSFGGKVALQYAALRETGPLKLFIVDSLPGARPDRRGSKSTVAVVEMLRGLPAQFATRQAFVDWVTARGHGEALAHWLAMNLHRTEAGFVFALDVRRIAALLNDYFEKDLWPVLNAPSTDLQAHLIIGGRSTVYNAEDQAYAKELASRMPDQIHTTIIEHADHWVHIDAPKELRQLVTEAT